MAWDQQAYDRKRYAEQSKDPAFLEKKRIASKARRDKLKASDPNYLDSRREYNARHTALKMAENPEFKAIVNERRKRWETGKLELDPLYVINIKARAKAVRQKKIELKDPTLEQQRVRYNQKGREKRTALKDNPEYRASKRAQERRNARLRVIGITQEGFDSQLEAQGYACGICRALVEEGAERPSERACADHCHVTRKFRGVLCGPCNSGIGLLGDDPQIISTAAKWVSSEPKQVASITLPLEIGDPGKLYERKRSRRRRGLDHDEVIKHLVCQAYQCGICCTPVTDSPSDIRKKACADHEHSSGRLRGVLCAKCNTALGLFKDSTQALNNASKWVAK